MKAARSLVAAGVLGGMLTVAAAATAAQPHASTMLVDTSQGRWYAHDAGGGIRTMYYGNPGDVPFLGDWDCDGLDTPGMYRPGDGYVYLRNSTTQGSADVTFYFGNPGDLPLPGDFDGDGCDTVSVIRPSQQRVYVVNRLGSRNTGLGAADYSFAFGEPGDLVFAGDWDGDGIDTVGLYRPSTARFTLAETSRADSTRTFTFGNPGDRGFAADWDGDGVDGVGVYRPSARQIFTRTDNGGIVPGESFGGSEWSPVAGVFDAADMRVVEGGGPLAPGDRGADVVRLQTALADAKFYRFAVDGVYGRELESAVLAFHKFVGTDRTTDWRVEDWLRLESLPGLGVPDRPFEPNRLEADLSRQLLFYFADGELAAVVHISSGGGYTYWSTRWGRYNYAGTPRGDFQLLYFGNGWNTDSTTGWSVYNYWAFTGYYGIHGYLNVPAYPASHGCIRVNIWEADWLKTRLHVGMPLHVWG